MWFFSIRVLLSRDDEQPLSVTDYTVFCNLHWDFYFTIHGLWEKPLPFTPSPLSFRIVKASYIYQPAMTYQVAVRVHTFSPIKAGWVNPAGGKDPKSRQQSQRQTPFPLLRISQEDQATLLQYVCRRARSILCQFSGWWSNSLLNNMLIWLTK